MLLNTRGFTSTNSGKYLRTLIISLIICIVIFLVLGVVLPAARAELIFHSESVDNPVFSAENSNDSVNMIISALELKKAYLRSCLLASKSDSVALIINLPDSTVTLQLYGVPLFTAKLSAYRKSAIFNKYSPAELSHWSEYPLTVVHSLSSIPKEPTIEALEQAKNHVIPDGKEDTWFRLYTDRNAKIVFNQTDKPSVGSDPGSRRRYFRKARKLERRELVHSLSNLEIPDFYPNITLYLSGSDARVIYRAIPEHALVVLRL